MLNIENGQGATALDQTQWIDQRQGYAVIPSSGSLGTQCEVSINTGTLGTGNNALSVASGSVLFDGGSVSVSAQNVDVDAGDSNPRKDVVYVDSGGNAQVRKGAPATVPADAPGDKFQTWHPAPYDMHDVESVVLAVVWVGATASSVTASDLRDRRLPADGKFSAVTADSLTDGTDGQAWETLRESGYEVGDSFGGFSINPLELRQASTTSTSYQANNSQLDHRVVWDHHFPADTTAAVAFYTYVAPGADETVDVRLYNDVDNETIVEATGITSTGPVSLGPTEYKPTTTGDRIILRAQWRTNPGSASSDLFGPWAVFNPKL